MQALKLFHTTWPDSTFLEPDSRPVLSGSRWPRSAFRSNPSLEQSEGRQLHTHTIPAKPKTLPKLSFFSVIFILRICNHPPGTQLLALQLDATQNVNSLDRQQLIFFLWVILLTTCVRAGSFNWKQRLSRCECRHRIQVTFKSSFTKMYSKFREGHVDLWWRPKSTLSVHKSGLQTQGVASMLAGFSKSWLPERLHGWAIQTTTGCPWSPDRVRLQLWIEHHLLLGALNSQTSQLSELIGWYRSLANSSIFTPLFQDPYHIKCDHPAVGPPTCLQGNNEAAASWSQILYFETRLWKSGSRDGLLDLFLGSSLTGWRLLKILEKRTLQMWLNE